MPPTSSNLILKLSSFEFSNMHFVLAGSDHISIGHDIIKNAFQIWQGYDLDLSPMRQSIEQTTGHLQDKGFIIFLEKEPIATVSLEQGEIIVQDSTITFIDGKNSVVYNRYSDVNIKDSNLLVVKKFAVNPDKANKGLGLNILKRIEFLAEELGFDGTVLETVKEATWLYQWYLARGYRPIGTAQYPDSKYETILMVGLNE